MSITYLYYTQQKLKYQYVLCKTEQISSRKIRSFRPGNPTRQTIKKKAYSWYNLIKIKEHLAGCCTSTIVYAYSVVVQFWNVAVRLCKSGCLASQYVISLYEKKEEIIDGRKELNPNICEYRLAKIMYL